MFRVRVVADSIGPSGNRLTTIEYTAPRIILAEINTHRAFSRNAESSRARPVEKLMASIESDPFIPIYWGQNQPGMQAAEEVDALARANATKLWLDTRDIVLRNVRQLHDWGVHKQTANRLLEPFMWVTGIISSTEWGNFFSLRCHPAAQPEMQVLADLILAVWRDSRPVKLMPGQWHLPYLLPDEGRLPLATRKAVSVARCARVSTLKHGEARDYDKEVAFHNRLAESGHWSPFEHVAQALKHDAPCGNFIGWKQYRKEFVRENQRQFDPDSRVPFNYDHV